MKVKAKWIYYGEGLARSGDYLKINTGDGLTIQSGQVKVDPTVLRTTGYQVITGKKVFTIHPEVPGTPPTPDAVANKAYVDNKLQGLHWRPPLYSSDQLVSGATGGIRPCSRLAVLHPELFTVGEHIYCTFDDGQPKSFTLTIVATGQPGPGEIDISDNPDAETLANRILTAIQTLATSGDVAAAYFSQYSNVSESRVHFIYHAAIKISQLHVYVSTALESAVYINNTEYDNIGRSYADLLDNETHMTIDEDIAYTWDYESDSWIPLSGSATVPLATKDTAGKVRPLNGIGVVNGDIYIDIADPSGLELVGVSPYKQLVVSDSIAGDGLKIIDKVLHLDLTPSGGLEIDVNGQVKVKPDDFINPGAALEVDTSGKIGVKTKPQGGILIDPIDGLYLDVDAIEELQQETFYIDTTLYNQGYIELSQTPVSSDKVRVIAINGVEQVNKAAIPIGSPIIPDFEMCTESGYENRLYFRNGISIGSFISSGLSEDIQAGDYLLVVYEV